MLRKRVEGETDDASTVAIFAWAAKFENMKNKENLYTPNCIRLHSGAYFNPLAPDEGLICIEDIAHSLSMQCRFGGHTKVFYSVAEHCVNVARRVESKNSLAGLLHDASEAYLYDIPRPIKINLVGYKEMEDTLMKVISTKFGFQYPLSPDVKKADRGELEWEWETIVIKEPKFIPLSPIAAKWKFLSMFELLASSIQMPNDPI